MCCVFAEYRQITLAMNFPRIAIPKDFEGLFCLRVLIILMVTGLRLNQAPAQPNVNRQQFDNWGLAVYNRIENEFRKPNSQLYVESVSSSGMHSGGTGGYAFVWPAGIQFRVLNALVRRDSLTFASRHRAFSDELISGYWRFTNEGGYRSGVTSNSTVFYDDNAHIVIAEMEAYASTGSLAHLQRARNTFDFVLRGEDQVAGGGIWFRENLFSHKDTISTLQAARGAAMLYRATGEQDYVDDARRLLNWANSHVQMADGLFHQNFNVATNMPEGIEIVNSAGIGISANLELYKATSTPSYLTEAKRIASRSLHRYTDFLNTKRINDEGFWAFELADALVDLYEIDPSSVWSEALSKGLTYLHDVKEDVNGHYGKFWGREPHPTPSTPFTSWNLIDQAPVAHAYLNLSQIRQGLPGDFNEDGVVDAADYTVWRDSVGKSVVLLPNAFGAGMTDIDQYTTWRQSYGNQTPNLRQSEAAVPEPSLQVVISVLALLSLSSRCLCFSPPHFYRLGSSLQATCPSNVNANVAQDSESVSSFVKSTSVASHATNYTFLSCEMNFTPEICHYLFDFGNNSRRRQLVALATEIK
jgi:hypothetical protein